MLYVFAVHLAQYVAALLGTVLELVICVPPVCCVNQPVKVRPVHVGVGSEPKELPGIRLSLVGFTDPPFGFHVIVTVFTDHLAQYVVALLGTVLVLKICVPPVAALVLNHPTKLCPVRVRVGSVPN
jgi:hypothetical protein